MAKPAQVKTVIKAYFDNKRYNYDIEEKEAFSLLAGFKTDASDGTIAVVFTVHNNDINLVTTYSETVSQEDFTDVAEFMLRVNRYR